MTEGDVLQLLRKRYPPNAYVILPQVRNGTGFARAPRTADALVMSLWPSRGVELMGVEIKVSRADWLRELQQPDKAESLFGYCDRWWVVISERSVVQSLTEVPSTWGLLAIQGSVIKVLREAPTLTPMPLDRLMLASLLRKMTDQQGVKHAHEEGFRQGRQEGQALGEVALDEAKRQLEAVRRTITQFEQTSGIRITDWRGPERIGSAVRLILDGQQDVEQTVRQWRESCRSLQERLDQALDELTAFPLGA